MFNLLAGPLTQLVSDVLDRVWPDPAQKAEAMLKVQELAQSGELQRLAMQTQVVSAEINGESAAQRNWRPHLMYLLMGLMVFNGVLVPLLWALFGLNLPVLEAWNTLPTEMWTLLQIGMGGYIGCRTAEKIMDKVGPISLTRK